MGENMSCYGCTASPIRSLEAPFGTSFTFYLAPAGRGSCKKRKNGKEKMGVMFESRVTRSVMATEKLPMPTVDEDR